MKHNAIVGGAAAICVALFAYTQYMIFFGSPLDAALYWNQKIFYYHVPCAFMLFLAVIISGVASLKYLRKRTPESDDLAEAAGEIAVVFGIIMLVTGSIWAKVAWEKWWVWDARLSSALSSLRIKSRYCCTCAASNLTKCRRCVPSACATLYDSFASEPPISMANRRAARTSRRTDGKRS